VHPFSIYGRAPDKKAPPGTAGLWLLPERIRTLAVLFNRRRSDWLNVGSLLMVAEATAKSTRRSDGDGTR